MIKKLNKIKGLRVGDSSGESGGIGGIGGMIKKLNKIKCLRVGDSPGESGGAGPNTLAKVSELFPFWKAFVCARVPPLTSGHESCLGTTR